MAKKILIVDDEADMRTVLFHTLRGAGYEVGEAAGGEEALRKIRRTRYDLVLLDIMMPKMSGYEVLERIRKMPSRVDTRVVVLTAKHDPEGIKREVAAGATDHIAKPFLPSELLEVIKRALKGPKKAVEQRRKELRRSAEVYGALRELRRDLDD